MIQYYDNTPFCILSLDEHNEILDLQGIHNLIKTIKDDILLLPINDEYKDDTLTARWKQWNIFLLKQSILHPIYRVITKGVRQYFKELKITDKNLYINGWANLTEKNTQITGHSHSFPISGYIPISAEPSKTIFKWNNNEYGINNTNGQLVLSLGNIYHGTSFWKDDDPRTSIAFDVIPGYFVDKHVDGPLIPMYI